MDQAINHKIHYISRQQRQEILAIARGEAVADYLIENVVILDLINGGEIAGPIAIKGRYIAGIGSEYNDAPTLQRIDAHGAIAVPWFIDAHLHIESSMMTPVTFETATLPRGLTTVICDPHEIVNVMGEAGFAGLPAVPNRLSKTSICRSVLAYPLWKAAMLTVPVLPLNRCSPGGTIRRLPALQK